MSNWAARKGSRFSRQLPGYQGLLTLIDRDNRRLVLIGLYDGEENLRWAHEIMNGPPPESMPQQLRESIPDRTFVGLFEVLERDGV